MAVDAYMAFIEFDNKPLKAESMVNMQNNDESLATTGPISLKTLATAGQLFEVKDYSFSVEQKLNIGSQSMGIGAGKITFNTFSVTRKIDIASPIFFRKACAGTPFQHVILACRKSSGGLTAGAVFLRFDFKLVGVTKIDFKSDEESPEETLEFEYGGLSVRYCRQLPNGTFDSAIQGGWLRVNNVVDAQPDSWMKSTG
jgi:type VI secretion system secreted protein Hcp